MWVVHLLTRWQSYAEDCLCIWLMVAVMCVIAPPVVVIFFNSFEHVPVAAIIKMAKVVNTNV
jgi:hypothetical protein